MSYSQEQRMQVSWAAGTLTNLGCTLHPTKYGWDVELPDGSWMSAETPGSLCRVAHTVRKAR